MSNYPKLYLYSTIILLLITLTLALFSKNFVIAFILGITIFLLLKINDSIAMLIKQAQTDTLTGLLRQGILKQYYQPYIYNYLLIIDIDNFKSINDRFGHPTGNEYLLQLTKLLLATFDKSPSLISREGGDEFLILLRATEEEILALMQELTKSNVLPITLSIGITITNKKTFSEAYKEADTALYKAKNAGKNQFVFF